MSVGHDRYANLTSISDAAGFGRTLGYDSNHHLTSDNGAPYTGTFTYDSNSGLLTGMNRGGGSTYTIISLAGLALTNISTGPTLCPSGEHRS